MASVTYTATQANGAASDFGAIGSPHNIQVVSNKYSTNNFTNSSDGSSAIGFTITATLQVEVDIDVPTGGGAGYCILAFRDSTTFNGYAVALSDGYKIRRYNGGGFTDLASTNRTSGRTEHITFTRNHSTGVMNIYAGATLMTTATDTSFTVGQLFILSLNDTGSPTTEATADNIVVSDTITGPPGAGGPIPLAATVAGTSTAAAVRLGLGRPVVGTAAGLSTTTAALSQGRPLAGTATGASTAVATGLAIGKALAGTAAGLSTFTADGGYRWNGVTGQYLAMRPSTSADIAGDICIVADLVMDDWTPAAIGVIANRLTGTGGRVLTLRVNVGGFLTFITSPDSTTVITLTSTAAIGLTDGVRGMVAVTHDVDNGAGGHTARFWTSSNGGALWTQLGTDVVTAVVTSRAPFPQPVEIGSASAGSSNALLGNTFSLSIRSGMGAAGVVGGTEVARFDAGGLWSQRFYTDAYSNVWQMMTAVNGTAAAGTSTAVATTLLSGGMSASAAGLSTTTAALSQGRPLAGTATGLSTAGASTLSGGATGSAIYTATQGNGAAVDFATIGSPHDIEVLSQKYSSNAYGAVGNFAGGASTIPFDISVDLQVDFDVNSPLTIGSGFANVQFRNVSTGAGYSVMCANSWHIYVYPSGGGAGTYLTNVGRSVRAEHTTFIRQGATGDMFVYANGILVASANDTSTVAGQAMIMTLIDIDGPTTEATLDNIVVSNVITGPPNPAALAASVSGTSTALGALGKASPIAAGATGLSTAVASALAIGKPLAGTAAGLSTAGATTLINAGAFAASAAGLSTAAGALTQSRPVEGTAAGLSATTAALALSSALQATAAGLSTSSADLTVLSPGAPYLGTAAGTSAAAGSLSQTRPLGGTAAGLSTAVASGLSRAVPLVASAAGLSTAAASALAAGSGFTGVAAGTGAAGAVSLAALVALTGSATGAAGTAGALRTALALRALATAAGMSTATGSISVAVYHAVQVWYDGSWQTMTIRVWNGTNWSATAQVWNGSEWQVLA